MMAAIWKMAFDRVSPIDLKSFSQAHPDLIYHGIRRR